MYPGERPLTRYERIRRACVMAFVRRWIAEGFAPSLFEGRLFSWRMFFPPRQDH